ncbi:MAG: STAS domain-containing protein [Planctomycetota bacterium]
MSADNYPDESFSLDSYEVEGITVVTLPRTIPPSAMEKFKTELLALANTSQRAIILDLSNLHFANSAVLGVIVSAHRACHERGDTLCFIKPRDAVAQLLRISQLDRLILSYPNFEAARVALMNQSG